MAPYLLRKFLAQAFRHKGKVSGFIKGIKNEEDKQKKKEKKGRR